MIKANERPTSSQWGLLLDADPSKEQVENYLKKGLLFSFENSKDCLGVMILIPHKKNGIEIANIAVHSDYQRQGVGHRLLEFAQEYALVHQKEELFVATAEVSHGPLHFYHSFGFKPYQRVPNFFLENYAQPIYDEGAQCIDLLRLKKIVLKEIK